MRGGDMDALQQEILRVLIRGEKTTGAIMNALNGKGWKVSLRDVAAAVHELEGMGFLDCLWRISQHEIRTPIGAKPRGKNL